MIDLHTNYVGLKLKNPLIAAPAAVTGTVDRMRKAEDAGIGAVVVKTLSELEITRKSPTPRFKVLRRGSGNFKSTTLYSYEQGSIWDPEEYADLIRQAKQALEIPLIASICCVSTEGWVHHARLIEQAGADALEINSSSPLTISAKEMENNLSEIVELVRQSVSIPIIPKLSGQLTNPISVAKSAEKAGADGVVMFNRFTGLEIDIDKERPVMHGGYGGHGGAWALNFVLRWISAAFPALGIDISASGGVFSGEDVVKCLLAGATTVQTCSAIILKGYNVVSEFLQELREWMDKKEYSTISEFHGSIATKILSLEEIDRSRNQVAYIDQDLCNSCGICHQACFYSAIERLENTYKILENCDGCGLCTQLCPTEAIEMRNIGSRNG